MRKILLVGLSILLISISNASYVTDLEDTVIKQEDKIERLERDLAVEKAKKNNSWLFKIPFTGIGISQDEAKGSIVTLASIYIHPIFIVGFLL